MDCYKDEKYHWRIVLEEYFDTYFEKDDPLIKFAKMNTFTFKPLCGDEDYNHYLNLTTIYWNTLTI